MTATALLIPGNMCDARLFAGPPALADVLAARGLAVAHADLARDATIAGMAARALAAAVTGPLVPIGFSLGAIVALAVAAAAPGRVLGAVLLGLNAGADLPDRAAARPGHQARALGGELEQMVIEDLKPRYFAAVHRDDPAIREPTLAMARDLGAGVFVAQSEALRTRPDLRPVLAALDVPLLLGVGAEDALCPPESHLGWQRLARRARLVVFEGAGHMLPLEAPGALAAVVGAWVEETGL